MARRIELEYVVHITVQREATIQNWVNEYNKLLDTDGKLCALGLGEHEGGRDVITRQLAEYNKGRVAGVVLLCGNDWAFQQEVPCAVTSD